MRKIKRKRVIAKPINIFSTPSGDAIRVWVKNASGKRLKHIAVVPKTYWRDVLQKRVDALETSTYVIRKQANEIKQQCGSISSPRGYTKFDIMSQPQYEIEREHIHMGGTKAITPYTDPSYLRCLDDAHKLEKQLIPLSMLTIKADDELARYDDLEHLKQMDIGGYDVDPRRTYGKGKGFFKGGMTTKLGDKTNFCNETCERNLMAIKERIAIEEILKLPPESQKDMEKRLFG